MIGLYIGCKYLYLAVGVVTARHTGKNGENTKSVDCSMNEKTKLERGERERERVAVRATGK